MHGISKEITLDGVYLGQGADPWGGTRIAFEASKTINRKDFGLNWNAVLEAGALLVSEKVEIRLEIQAVKQ
jgi:polyisoprenoid-binding protein YceI